MTEAADVYLDNNATTPMAPEALAAMSACLSEVWGNPSSAHRLGMLAKERVLAARRSVATLIGASPGEIVFTSGATESNHAALRSALAAGAPRRGVVASAVEHPSTLALLTELESRGARVTRVGVDSDGLLDWERLATAVDDDTALVTLMWANNETGILFDVERAAAIAHRAGALFHTDAVQAAGRVDIDAGRVPFDLLSLSAHKLHGPKGIGALFVRKGVPFRPQTLGHQERGRRGGTENVPAMVGFGAAAEISRASLGADAASMRSLRDRLERGLREQVPALRIHGAAAARLCNTSNLRVVGLESEPILDRLDRAGICASSGAACTAGGTEPSHVLRAMGLSREDALGAMRFSLSRYADEAQIDRTVRIFAGIVGALLNTTLESMS